MSKFTENVNRRLYELESKSKIETQYWNGETRFISRIPLRQIILGLLDHLDLEIDGKPNIIKVVPKEDNGKD